MISLIVIFILHWIGDFLLQTTEMALNKSKSNDALLRHVIAYIFPFCLISFIFVHNELKLFYCAMFIFVTFISHFITDYFTSRWTSKLYAEQKFYGFPAFFSVIGFDQLLHHIQLTLCWMWFIRVIMP